MMPTNEYVEVRNGGYYVAGTRIGLDVVVYDFRDGRTAEAIFDAYPSIGSLAKVYGTITYILEHPRRSRLTWRTRTHFRGVQSATSHACRHDRAF